MLHTGHLKALRELLLFLTVSFCFYFHGLFSREDLTSVKVVVYFCLLKDTASELLLLSLWYTLPTKLLVFLIKLMCMISSSSRQTFQIS